MPMHTQDQDIESSTNYPSLRMWQHSLTDTANRPRITPFELWITPAAAAAAANLSSPWAPSRMHLFQHAMARKARIKQEPVPLSTNPLQDPASPPPRDPVPPPPQDPVLPTMSNLPR
ncbi:hypothetical protein PTTG_29783 [Puccinia triticina 1-1 BBBD Race 1]|uniref:Uncharacterized protein n=1 Tax=Puccinia triticina (isolate 1-1 / race 1 (BBBD)) TaxID=630390 RepID=A0A180G216_PUCT1|nr:hypothetical protein PTTG_29783 [Puccinia triticina 1-1 BBBD Race 1]